MADGVTGGEGVAGGGFEQLIRGVRGSPLAMANLAHTLLLPRGEEARARELCMQAQQLAPGDGEVRAICAEVFSHQVGAWYFSMVLDETRHGAYRQAFERALRGGGRVLDLGAGTGLFAMMAARAGADEVIACERRSAVAEAAAAVVERNGLQDRVKVINKLASELVIGRDIDGPADVLIWDNLSDDMLGAGALPAIEDALRRLVKPGGRVIPARCSVKAALAQDQAVRRRAMGVVSGFDLTPFNRFAKPSYSLDSASTDLFLRSDAATLFAFDLQSGGPFPPEKTRQAVTGAGGEANGAVLWLDFDLDGFERYDSAPGKLAWAFGVVFVPFEQSLEAVVGQSFTLGAAHDREHVRVWLEGKED